MNPDTHNERRCILKKLRFLRRNFPRDQERLEWAIGGHTLGRDECQVSLFIGRIDRKEPLITRRRGTDVGDLVGLAFAKNEDKIRRCPFFVFLFC